MCLLEEALSCSSVYRKFSRILDSVVRLDLDKLVNSLNKWALKVMLNTLKFLKESAWPWLSHCHIQHQWRWQLCRSNLPLGLHVLHCLLPVCQGDPPDSIGDHHLYILVICWSIMVTLKKFDQVFLLLCLSLEPPHLPTVPVPWKTLVALNKLYNMVSKCFVK